MASTTADRAAQQRVAVVGTGTMGSAMARNLLRAGLVVNVWWHRRPLRRGWPQPGQRPTAARVRRSRMRMW